MIEEKQKHDVWCRDMLTFSTSTKLIIDDAMAVFHASLPKKPRPVDIKRAYFGSLIYSIYGPYNSANSSSKKKEFGSYTYNQSPVTLQLRDSGLTRALLASNFELKSPRGRLTEEKKCSLYLAFFKSTIDGVRKNGSLSDNQKLTPEELFYYLMDGEVISAKEPIWMLRAVRNDLLNTFEWTESYLGLSKDDAKEKDTLIDDTEDLSATPSNSNHEKNADCESNISVLEDDTNESQLDKVPLSMYSNDIDEIIPDESCDYEEYGYLEEACNMGQLSVVPLYAYLGFPETEIDEHVNPEAEDDIVNYDYEDLFFEIDQDERWFNSHKDEFNSHGTLTKRF